MWVRHTIDYNSNAISVHPITVNAEELPDWLIRDAVRHWEHKIERANEIGNMKRGIFKLGINIYVYLLNEHICSC